MFRLSYFHDETHPHTSSPSSLKFPIQFYHSDFLHPPGITSTESTAHSYSRIHPLHPSNRRKNTKFLTTISVQCSKASSRPVRTCSTPVPGAYLLIRLDSQIFVVQTTPGYLITYSLASDLNARGYKPSFVNSHHHAQHNSMAVGVKADAGPGGLLLGTREVGGVREFSVRFRMGIKLDAGISRFGYPAAMTIETEVNSTLEIRTLALDDELLPATIKPAAVQCIRWTPDSTRNQTAMCNGASSHWCSTCIGFPQIPVRWETRHL